MVKKILSLTSAFFIVIALYIFYFLLKFECQIYPMDVHGATMGEYTIVALRQGCPMDRGHHEYYVKRKDDVSDGYDKRNLIVETLDGHVVKVQWVAPNVIQVKFYGEETLRKISKSAFGNDIQIEHLDWNNKPSLP